jgi:hypothetical protein
MTSDNVNSVINPIQTLTNSSGEAKFYVGCTTATTNVAFIAHFVDLEGSPATLSIIINFYDDNSIITAPEYVYIDSEEGKITVTIKDTNNDVYPGKTVGCISNQPTDSITVTGNPTNGSGQSFFTISSTEVHVSTIIAENKTDGYNISNEATITFISVPPVPPIPTDSLVARFESDHGVSTTGTNIDSWEDNGYGNTLYYAPDYPDKSPMLYDGTLTPIRYISNTYKFSY